MSSIFSGIYMIRTLLARSYENPVASSHASVLIVEECYPGGFCLWEAYRVRFLQSMTNHL